MARRLRPLPSFGASLIDPARAMRDAAHGIALRAAGQGEALSGSVRITASVAVTVYHLPAIVADIRKQEPQIAIDLVASDETSNLHFARPTSRSACTDPSSST
jgi:DNA-binding transcriptional LysR family regulator